MFVHPRQLRAPWAEYETVIGKTQERKEAQRAAAAAARDVRQARAAAIVVELIRLDVDAYYFSSVDNDVRVPGDVLLDLLRRVPATTRCSPTPDGPRP
jgi:hypothetical protein